MAETSTNVTEGSGKRLRAWDRTVASQTVLDEVVVLGEPYVAEYTTATITPVSTATANSHVLQIMAGSSNRVRVRRIEVHQMVGATTAAFCQWAIYRLTTAGTGGTSITPQLIDPSDAAVSATSMTLPTVKGTEGALLWSGATPMTQTISATPAHINPILVWEEDGRRKPIHIAAGTSNGIALKNITAIAGATVIVTAWFSETAWI